jgi:hypothetical protein
MESERMRIADYVAANRNVGKSKRATARYEQILAKIQDGNQTPAQLGEVLGESARAIGATLQRMQARGLVRLVYRWEAVQRSCEKENIRKGE